MKYKLEIDYDERGWSGHCEAADFEYVLGDLDLDAGWREPANLLTEELCEALGLSDDPWPARPISTRYSAAALRELKRRVDLQELLPPGAGSGGLRAAAPAGRTGEFLDELSDHGERVWIEAREEGRLRILDEELAARYIEAYSARN